MRQKNPSYWLHCYSQLISGERLYGNEVSRLSPPEYLLDMVTTCSPSINSVLHWSIPITKAQFLKLKDNIG